VAHQAVRIRGRGAPPVVAPGPKVNTLLQRHHPDFAALRRYLIDEGFMERHAGIYRRLA